MQELAPKTIAAKRIKNLIIQDAIMPKGKGNTDICSMISNSQKTVVVIGASPNPDRYSFRATEALAHKGYHVIPIGIREGKINTHKIITERPILQDIHTVTLYVGPEKLKDWMEYITLLKPERVIFNPGTYDENSEKEFRKAGMETIEACTLVMLSLNQF